MTQPHRVLIAGGGVAAAEALMALADLAPGQVAVTLLSPKTNFLLRPQTAGEPFGGPALRMPLDDLAMRFGAASELGSLRRVDLGAACAQTAAGETLGFDSLLLAVGGRPAHPYPLARTLGFGPLPGTIAAGAAGSVAVVAPPGTTWTLPAYQLALLIARTSPHRVTVVSPEARPLEAFGDAAADAVARLLSRAGVELRTCTALTTGSDVSWLAETVIALPLLEGPAIEGLRADAHGFVYAGDGQRLAGAETVWGAGDAVAGTIKQGGLAAQQALEAAVGIARTAGADVTAPSDLADRVLRGKLLAPDGETLYLRRSLGSDDPGQVSGEPLWKPQGMLYSRYLMTWLTAHGIELGTDPLGPVGLPVATSS